MVNKKPAKIAHTCRGEAGIDTNIQNITDMKKFKRLVSYVYFQIGVNIIGLPEFHVHIRSREVVWIGNQLKNYHK